MSAQYQPQSQASSPNPPNLPNPHNIPPISAKPVALHSKIATIGVIIAISGLMMVLQLLGVYLGALIVFDNSAQLSATYLLMQGSADGSVIAISILLTGLMMVAVIFAWVGLKIHLQTKQGQCQLTIADYLAIKPFSLKVALQMIGILVLFVIASETLTYVLDQEPTEFLNELYATASMRWLLVFVIVIIAPIYEEMIYRGLFWTAISEQWLGQGAEQSHTTSQKGQWIASIVTSILFALIHLQYGLYEMATIAVLAMVLCLARVKSGSLLLPILLHIINNGLAMGQYVLMFEG